MLKFINFISIYINIGPIFMKQKMKQLGNTY